MKRPRWHDDAACRTADPDLFFPATPTPQAAAKAAAVCATCPVRTPCRHAGATEAHGVWGGASEDQRRTARSTRRTTASR